MSKRETRASTRTLTSEQVAAYRRDVAAFLGYCEAQGMSPQEGLSRARAGVRGRCLIVNMPGSPKAVRECMEIVIQVIPHAVEIMRGEVTEHTISMQG